MIILKREILEELVLIADKAKPKEASAYLFKDNTIVLPMSKDGFDLGHFQDVDQELTYEFIKRYGKPSAIFHSHPCEAMPSIIDFQFMQTTIPIYGCVWLILSNMYKIRGWTIREKHLIEEGVFIEDRNFLVKSTMYRG